MVSMVGEKEKNIEVTASQLSMKTGKLLYLCKGSNTHQMQTVGITLAFSSLLVSVSITATSVL